MSTVKDKAREIVNHLPDDATWRDLMYEIEVRRRIEQGLRDIAAGRVTPHEEVRRRFTGG